MAQSGLLASEPQASKLPADAAPDGRKGPSDDTTFYASKCGTPDCRKVSAAGHVRLVVAADSTLCGCAQDFSHEHLDVCGSCFTFAATDSGNACGCDDIDVDKQLGLLSV